MASGRAARGGRRGWCTSGLTILGVLALLLALGGNTVRAEEGGDFAWGLQFETQGYAREDGRVAATDTAIYVGGLTSGVMPGEQGAGHLDAYVRKYDLAGQELWTRQFGAPGMDRVQAVAADATGVYVAGQTYGALGEVPNAGQFDAYVRKYDVHGDLVWTAQFGSDQLDEVHGLALDATGVYCAGETRGSLFAANPDFDPDPFAARLDAQGNLVWGDQFGGSAYDSAFAATFGGGRLFVAGYTNGTLPDQVRHGYGWNAFVRAYDVEGQAQWTTQYAASVGQTTAWDVVADESALYVVGYARGRLGDALIGGYDSYLRKYDHDGAILWTEQFGSVVDDFAAGVALADGAVYVSGRVTGALDEPYLGGIADGYVRRYDTAGNLAWGRQIGTEGFDVAESVACAGGLVVVSGTTDGYLVERDQPLVGTGDAYVMALDAQGAEAWTDQIGTFDHQYSMAEALGTDGRLYAAGHTTGSLDGEDVDATSDPWLRAYDAEGELLWTRQLRTDPGMGVATAVAVDATGVYVAGYYSGVLLEGPSVFSMGIFVLKYDSAGDMLWSWTLDTPATDYVEGLAADASGLYVAGYTYGAFEGQTSAGEADAFVIRLSISGELAWIRQFGTSGHDRARAVAPAGDGVYVGGQAPYALPGAGAVGYVDAWVGRMDAAGNFEWVEQYGTSGYEDVWGLCADETGVYATGSVEGSMDGAAWYGFRDAYVRKLAPNGAHLWTAQFGTPAYDVAGDVAVDANGVHVAGRTSGSLPGFTNFGSSDAFVAQFDHAGALARLLQFGTEEAEVANGIASDGSNVYVTGWTRGLLFSDEHRADTPADAFLAKLRPLDSDGDGLSDEDELLLGTDPLDWDTDDDGLDDGSEVEMAAGGGCPDPLDADSDDDNLLDGEEVLEVGTSPCNADTDGDGCPDDIDPDPLNPGAAPGDIQDLADDTSDVIDDLDLSLIDAPNDNAAGNLISSLSKRVSNAAKAIERGDYAEAIEILEGVLAKLDGEAPDWVEPSPEQEALARTIEGLLALLGA